MKSLHFIIEIFRKYPGLCLANVCAAVVMSSLGAVTLLCLTPIIDMFLHQDGQNLSPLTLKVTGIMHAVGLPVSLGWAMGLLVILVFATSTAQILGNMLIIRTKYALHKDLMMGAFEDFFRARWMFFSSSEQGRIFNTLNRELSSVGDGFIAIGALFSNLVQITIMAGIPLYISWKVTLLAIACGSVFSFLIFLVSRPSYAFGRRNTETANVLSGMVYENISAAKLVLGYGNREQCIRRLSASYDAHLDCTVKFQLLNYSVATAYRPIGVVVVVIVLLASKHFAVPLSEVTVLLLALFQMITLFGSVLAQKNQISYVVPGYEQIQSLRDRARAMPQVSGTHAFKGLSSGVTLEQVVFTYPGREPVLKGVDIDIPKGRMVAFVGKSGVGKSTLLDLVMGFHQPSEGRVLIDGIDLTGIDVNQYRSRIGYVPQEGFLFNASVTDNLRWAAPDASDQDIEEACRLAYADEFISELPEGYATVVGDRGVRLSGGQIQRMALARAFLRKPDLLIFDEATSALDSHSEQLIQQAIDAFAKKTTVVIVAHRLATIRRADIIYVLNQGRVAEHGSYEELCARGARFADMVKDQGLGAAA